MKKRSPQTRADPNAKNMDDTTDRDYCSEARKKTVSSTYFLLTRPKKKKIISQYQTTAETPPLTIGRPSQVHRGFEQPKQYALKHNEQTSSRKTSANPAGPGVRHGGHPATCFYVFPLLTLPLAPASARF